MDEHGKRVDVIIEDNYGRDYDTGLRKFVGLLVWADDGMLDITKAIPGIHAAFADTTRYMVFLDPRYDKEFIEKEIEAQIKIHLK